jgi:hypothetical protein
MMSFDLRSPKKCKYALCSFDTQITIIIFKQSKIVPLCPQFLQCCIVAHEHSKKYCNCNVKNIVAQFFHLRLLPSGWPSNGKAR